MAGRIGIEGVVLACEDTGGEGPAVLFLHGLGGTANGWLAQLRACEERGWRGIAPDQRGCGRSGGGELSIGRWAADAVALLDRLGVERAAVAGHSMGCMVAEHAAHELGERAYALALCGGTLAWPEGAADGFTERARLAREGRMDEIAEGVAATALSERCRREDPRLLGLFRESIAGNDGERYAAACEAVAKGAMRGPARLECPVLAFCGGADPVTPPPAAEEIAAAAPDGRAAVVGDAGHWCQVEAPEAANRVLFDFLENAG
ncbi:MAG TPA: alpha/beta hydrolase [Solirubrobacterales bacterium]|nr:alpha/beta hydrolase [Solirubrobacterales bacterium]